MMSLVDAQPLSAPVNRTPTTFGDLQELVNTLDTLSIDSHQLPRHAGHCIHGIGTTYTNTQHAHASGIWCVRIGSNCQTTRKGIVLKDGCVYDAGCADVSWKEVI